MAILVSALVPRHTEVAQGDLADLVQQLTDQICSLPMWDEEKLCTATNNLYHSMEQPPYSIQADRVCCFSISRRESETSSPDSYASSDGGNIQTCNAQQLHYPSHVHMDPGDVKLILPDSMAQLDDIIRHCETAVGHGYQKVLLKAFSDNSDSLSRFFYHLDNPWILRRSTETIIDPAECTEELTNTCTIMLKINTQVLCLMQQQLCEQSQSFGELKMGYFAQFAKSPINKLLEIAVSLSEANWSASHICPMLLAYEALVDVLPIIQKFPSCESDDFFLKILDNMKKAFRGIFDNIKHFIQYNMENHQGVTIHPMTCFLISSMKFFNSHRHLVQSTLAPGDDSNSFGHLLYDVITCWKSVLNQHSKVYADLPWRCIFLLNNTEHFNRKTDGLLDELLSDEQIIAWHSREFDLLFENWIKIYKEEAWRPAKSCLKHNSWWRSVHPSLVAFTSKFGETFDRQKTWKVPDVVLRQELKDHIADFILSDYIICLENYSKPGLFSCSCLRREQDILTEQRVRSAVQGLFEG